MSACGYVQKNQRFTRSGNLYGELDATNEMSAEKEKRTSMRWTRLYSTPHQDVKELTRYLRDLNWMGHGSAYDGNEGRPRKRVSVLGRMVHWPMVSCFARDANDGASFHRLLISPTNRTFPKGRAKARGMKATLTTFSFKVNNLSQNRESCQCVSVRALTKINDTFFF